MKGLKCNRKHNINELYAEVKQRHLERQGGVTSLKRHDVQHRCLKPQLRAYQKQAVEWMLMKERFWKDISNDVNG
jgi:hypothetical protein